MTNRTKTTRELWIEAHAAANQTDQKRYGFYHFTNEAQEEADDLAAEGKFDHGSDEYFDCCIARLELSLCNTDHEEAVAFFLDLDIG